MVACKTAVVTGANSGVGYALSDRLLDTYPDIKLSIVCRNAKRGQVALNSLLSSHPGASITLLLCDVGSIAAVRKCCKEIKQLYEHVDFLFLNAGIMANPRVKLGTVITTLFQPRKLVHRFSTGSDLLLIDDSETKEGFKATFATNVLGHFCMVQELDEVLGGSEPSRLVWTSSRMASKEIFSLDDIQHRSGVDPYSSSKYLMDALSVAMNDKLRNKNITTNTTCPGLMKSGMSLGILSWWIWFILVPVVKMLRLLVSSFTWDPSNGAEAMIWLTTQDAAALDPTHKYYSMCSVLGYPYTTTAKMDIDRETAEKCYDQLEDIIREFDSNQMTSNNA